MFDEVDTRQNFPDLEKKVLGYWEKEKTFKKSLKKEAGNFSFFDGPPFATGLPHYGHVVASIIKDVVPRFWTMKGKTVDRKWGWDCHGLPVENLIEKELGINNKQEIEQMGIDCFNDSCKSSVLRYADEWRNFIPRVGRWVDMDDDYKTMNSSYTESIWWVFSEMYKKGLVYEGYKSMHLCPRCETTLSNFEVTQGYKDITDLSATVKFKLKSGQKIGDFEIPENTFVLAWTTTPWTLPGNVALAVNKDITYVFMSFVDGGNYIFVKDNDKIEQIQLELMKDLPEERKDENLFEIHEVFEGEKLVGLEYDPLFDYYAKQEDLENKENGWKIYAGDFVSTEEGTGVVHIAPAFGEDDMNLAREKKLPFVQHVKTNGRFADFFSSFGEEDKQFFLDKDGSGREVKPKRNSRETDEKVVKYLEKENKLFASENYKHSYPHCWRCDTPLLNYASSSWFVEVTKIKDKLIKNNQQVNWVPGYIKDGRFGKWLEDARDWAISRSRFWGAPIPIWQCEECGEKEVLGSIDDLRERGDKKITKFVFVRHGFAENNINSVRSSGDNTHHLTDKGREQAEVVGEKLKSVDIDIIVSSPILRTMETAEIISKHLDGMPIEKEELVREYNFGSWDGFTSQELLESSDLYKKYKTIPYGEEKFKFPLGGDGESRLDVEKRIKKFIKSYCEKYSGKTILVVSHGGIGALFHKILGGVGVKEFFTAEFRVENAKHICFYANEKGEELNLHKPFIDEVKVDCPHCGGKMKIIGDVFDCWFESGSMPYAQFHYPFENQEKFNESFPADFIAEGLDQTRGWFYTLMVISTALFDKPAFKNVIVNGIVLAEDGQKMSKRLKNYPDPNDLIGKYGADALRYYLLTSPVMKAENLRFSERGVDEVLKKFILTLWNTYGFLVMNIRLNSITEEDLKRKEESDNVLDKWILLELDLLIKEVDFQMQNYDLVKASRVLRDFVDKLSNWYLRRSRKRFTSENVQDKIFAYQTLNYVLIEFSKVMAPFMPFISEEIFRNLTDKDSVHLEKFPEIHEISDLDVLDKMNLVRDVVTLGLAERAQNKIKVRMPLNSIKIKAKKKIDISEELSDIVKEELNVKNVEFENQLLLEDGEDAIMVELDLNITEELELEGISREIVRQVQSLRKQAKYERDAFINLKYRIDAGERFSKAIEVWSSTIKEECFSKEIIASDDIENDSDKFQELVLGEDRIVLAVELSK